MFKNKNKQLLLGGLIVTAFYFIIQRNKYVRQPSGYLTTYKPGKLDPFA